MSISLTQLIIGILGSGAFSAVLTVFLTWLKDFLSEESRRDRESKTKLYNPLRFYLMLMKINTETRHELLLSRQKRESQSGWDRHAEKEIMVVYKKDHSELINTWWNYARKVMYLFEEFPQYIEKADWIIVERLFRAHIFRKTISGEEIYKDTSYVYDFETLAKDDQNEFIKIFDELYEQII